MLLYYDAFELCELIYKILALVNSKQKFTSVRVIILTVIGAALEAAGIGLIIPFLSALVSEDFQIPNLILKFSYLNSLNREEIIIGSNCFICNILSFEEPLFDVSSCRSSWLLLQFTRVNFGTSIRLPPKPYAFHLQNNSAKLLSNTITESMQFATVTSAALLVINDVLIILAILAVLVAVEPSGALLTFALFGTLSWLLFKASKTRAALGRDSTRKERFRVKSAQHLVVLKT